MGDNSEGNTAVGTVVLARAARVSKIGSRAGRILKIIRMLRLIRAIKLYKLRNAKLLKKKNESNFLTKLEIKKKSLISPQNKEPNSNDAASLVFLNKQNSNKIERKSFNSISDNKNVSNLDETNEFNIRRVQTGINKIGNKKNIIYQKVTILNFEG